MGRPAKSAVEEKATVEKTTVAETSVNTAESKTKKAENKVQDKVEKPLNDTDEIEVVSLIPNVSYKDSHTGDIYEWDKIGHVEFLTFETLKNMWRNSKSYFRNMLLKPNDERVIKKFGLASTYEKYEFLMNESNYERENIDKICDAISSTPNGMKYTICNKIKNMVVAGKISDIKVIIALEKQLNLDLTSFLN